MCVRVFVLHSVCLCVFYCHALSLRSQAARQLGSHFAINFPSKWQLNYVFIDFAVFKYALSSPTKVAINYIVGNTACKEIEIKRERRQSYRIISV